MDNQPSTTQSESKTPAGVTVDATGVKRENGRFAPGGAKPKGSGWGESSRGRTRKLHEFAAKLCREEKFPFSDLLEWYIYIGLRGRDPLESRINQALGEDSPYHHTRVCEVGKDGQAVRTKFIDIETRMDCLSRTLRFMYPTLSSVEVSGPDGEPLIDQGRALAAELGKDPEARRLMEIITSKASSLSESGDPADESETDQGAVPANGSQPAAPLSESSE